MPSSDPAAYRIGAAARRTGLSEHLIRVWERRYGAVRPQRTESGIRLYTDAELKRLCLLKRAIERGHAIGSIAELGAEQLKRLAGEPVVNPGTEGVDVAGAEELVSAFMQAISALDLVGAEEVVARAEVALGTRLTALRVLTPVLREVGRQWEAGRLSIAQEHAAAAVVRNYLGSAARSLSRDERAPIAVSTTPPGELHEFGALVAAVYVASSGYRAAYLGPNLPNADLIETVRTLRARLVLLSAVSRSRGLEARLQELRDELSASVRIVVGGAAAQRLKQVPEGVARLERIEELGPLLDEARQGSA